MFTHREVLQTGNFGKVDDQIGVVHVVESKCLQNGEAAVEGAQRRIGDGEFREVI
jgi:hypothetical protein